MQPHAGQRSVCSETPVAKGEVRTRLAAEVMCICCAALRSWL